MIPTKRAHRLVALLAVPALFFVSACGSDDGGGGNGSEGTTEGNGAEDSGEGGTAQGVPVVTVSGDIGEEPVIEIDSDAEGGDETTVDVAVEGDGPEVAEGDYLRADVVGQNAQGEDLFNTWLSVAGEGADEDAPRQQYVGRTGEEGMLPQAIVDTLVGQTVGSRVVVTGMGEELIGPQAVQAGMEGLVFVIDIVAAAEIDPQAEAEGEQAPVEDGMPEVTAGGGAAEVTVPEGEDPPAELLEQVLIEGDGPEVEAGQGLVAQYTGVKWEDGEEFDSSYNREGASAFQIGTGSVVSGWDETLVGKKIGDRVLLVLPPDMAYGGSQSELAENTLIFVVDIVGVV